MPSDLRWVKALKEFRQKTIDRLARLRPYIDCPKEPQRRAIKQAIDWELDHLLVLDRQISRTVGGDEL